MIVIRKYRRRNKYGGDIVSGASKIADKIGIPLKNWHLPGHKFTGLNWPKLV